MLQEEILNLKENLTDANIKQIEDKRNSIAEKELILKKHCRHSAGRLMRLHLVPPAE